MKKKIKIISYYINPISIEELLNNVTKWIRKKKPAYICVSNVHSCIESFWNKKFKMAHNTANLAIPDGRPIFWSLKLLGIKNAKHLPGHYVTKKLCDYANKNNFKVGLLGSTNQNLNKIEIKLKKNLKNLKIVYKYSPPFRALNFQEDKEIVNKINIAKVDILLVFLGCPKQELWMYHHRNKLKCTMVGVGAVADFLSGNKILPNMFFEYLGLAWIIRLITEPRRLFWRYFSTNFLFIFLIFLQIMRLKKFK